MNGHEPIGRHFDAMLNAAALLLRAAFYAVVVLIAEPYDCGRALLGGIVLGDLAASAFALLCRQCENAAVMLAELALLAIAFVWVRSHVPWPHEPPDQALLFLAAFGVFAALAGRNVLLRIGPSESDFA